MCGVVGRGLSVPWCMGPTTDVMGQVVTLDLRGIPVDAAEYEA